MIKKDIVITISRPLKVNTKLKTYLLDNMWFRRQIYNKCVEVYRNWESLGDESKCKFDKNAFRRVIMDYAKTEFDYSYYCIGIVQQCIDDFYNTLDKIFYERKKGNKSKIRFNSYDKYAGSFKVYNKIIANTDKDKPTSAKCMIIDDSHVQITFNRKFNKHKLELKESLGYTMKNGKRIITNKFKNERYSFSNNDIKAVAFVKKFNKYYINLVVKVKVLEYDKQREPLAGIDLGIHNPVTIYYINEDGKDINFNISVPDKMKKRMKYLEDRITRLQSIMDRKMEINRKRVDKGEIPTVYTRNYEKVRNKFRISHKKLFNLKRDWRMKVSHYIATHYSTIVVDEFTSPVKDKETNKVSSLNKSNTELGMYYLIQTLRWMAARYNCNYELSPPDTTRTCSICGHINEHLKLGKRYLNCKRCGNKIDRDINAARNCYKYGLIHVLKV